MNEWKGGCWLDELIDECIVESKLLSNVID